VRRARTTVPDVTVSADLVAVVAPKGRGGVLLPAGGPGRRCRPGGPGGPTRCVTCTSVATTSRSRRCPCCWPGTESSRRSRGEGLQGLGARGLGVLAAWIYVFVAFVMLPVDVPISILLVEPPGWRRRVISAFLAMGGPSPCCSPAWSADLPRRPSGTGTWPVTPRRRRARASMLPTSSPRAVRSCSPGARTPRCSASWASSPSPCSHAASSTGSPRCGAPGSHHRRWHRALHAYRPPSPRRHGGSGVV